MENQDGSKLMTGYILACFVLAAGGMIGYKVMNDKRVELATQYRVVGQRYIEIRDYQSPSLRYYYKNPSREDDRKKKEERSSRTRDILERNATERTKLKKEKNQWIMKPSEKYDKIGKVNVNEMMVILDNVTSLEWSYFIDITRTDIGDFASMQALKIERSNRKYASMKLLKKSDSTDSTLWKVTITYRWYTPASA